MFERFTASARSVIVGSRREAQALHHSYIGTEHMLLALLTEEGTVAYGVLHAAGVDAAAVRAEVARLVGSAAKLLSDEDAAALRTVGIDLDTVLARIEESFGPDALATPGLRRRPDGPRRGLLRRRSGHRFRFTRRSKQVLELSLREASRLGHNYIGTEHILLGLLREGDGLAVKILTDAGLTPADLRAATLDALGRAA